MDWITILALLVAGIILVIIEIIFVPGTTILGIIGVALLIFGIIVGYSKFGPQTGTFILLGTLVLGGGTILLSFKSGLWQRFSLKTTNESKFNEDIKIEHLLGAEGVAVSALRPYGKVEIYDAVYEARTLGNYLEPGTKIKVTNIDKDHKIYVEQIKE